MSQPAQFVWSVVFLLGWGITQSPYRLLAVERDTPRETDSEAEQYVRQALEFRQGMRPDSWQRAEVEVELAALSKAQGRIETDLAMASYRVLAEALPADNFRLRRAEALLND